MLPIAIRIADKTYQVDLASLTASPIKVIVNGQPLEVRIDSEGVLATRKSGLPDATNVAAHAATRPVPAELHFRCHAE